MIDKIAEEGDKFLPIARHVAVNAGLVYPSADELSPEYLKSLATPLGRANYDYIFDKAKSHAAEVWRLLAKGIFESDTAYLTQIGNWSLDTGLDQNNQFVFWSRKA